MTLNITMVAPWGIWQSADLRLTNRTTGNVEDDTSIKHVAVRCSDGTALITYTGIGKVRDVSIADWIRHLIRGENRTVDQTLILIRESATRTFPRIAPGRELTFNIGAFLGRRPLAAIITNRRADGSIQSQFETSAIQIDEHNPGVLVTGLRQAMIAADSVLLTKTARSKPRRARFYHELLAGINLRASKHSIYGRYISPACITAHMPPKGEPVNYKSHQTGASSTNQQGGTIPMVFFGIDLTEMTDLLAENFRRLMSGAAVDEGKAAGQTEEAGKRSVVSRNLLQK